ncbi:MAG: hypothetical protein WBL07_08160, partial [Thiothrix litoralis]|uniref:hypothetical protein n=1 Tax=Thiothrix litoralis TaxID=2891210 RepID=UPI003C783130
FNNGMVSIRENISQAEAEAISQQLSTLAIKCAIRPTLQLVPLEENTQLTGPLYTCPACKHQQVQTKEHNEKCEACGVIGDSFLRTQRMKEAVESERQKYENELSKSIKAAEESAKRYESDSMYQEARRQLGVEDKSSDSKLKIVAVVAAIGIGIATLYAFNKPDKTTAPQPETVAATAPAQ